MIKRVLLLTILTAGLLGPVSAYACMGYSMEDTVFFPKVTEDLQKEDIVAEVKITDIRKKDNRSFAVADILSLKHGELPGRKIEFEIELTSCGPHQAVGESGLIIGRVINTDGKLPLLKVMMRKRGDE